MDRCDHCGLPITDRCISGDGEASDAQYCCYGCRMMADVGASDDPSVDPDAAHQALLYRLFAGALMAGFVMAISLAISSEYGFDAFRQLEHAVGTAHWVLLIAAVPALVLLGGPLLRATHEDLRQGRLTLNVLFALGTSSAVAVSVLSYVRGTGPIYLETATMLLALYTLGRYLTARVKGRTAHVMGRLLEVPDTTYERLRPDPGSVAGDDLRPGDRVRIRAGDVLPVDARVVSGRSFVDESSLTGEARPAVKTAGDTVYAGTSTLDGALTVRVIAVAEERRLARIEAMMREALARPPRIMELTNRIMRWLIPGIVVLAGATFVGWYAVAGFEKALYTALSVVLITCPCALGLAIPLVLVLALGEAGREGVLVRSGRALLDFSRAEAILFDKTGTLSGLERHAVSVVVPERRRVAAGAGTSPPALDADALLQQAASVEAGAQHVLATAIVDEAQDRQLDLLPAEDVQTHPGVGVTGWVRHGGERRRIGIGNAGLLNTLSITPDSDFMARAEAEQEAGRVALMVTIDRTLAGLLVLDEQIRDGAPEALQDLREQGLDLQILTGDRSPAARRIADAFGVSVRSALTPSDKVDALDEWRRTGGTVAMVGDGINDAAVIAEADIGIALASGAPISMEAADVTLYNPDLRGVAWLRRLADRSARIVRQNLWWTFGYNAVGVGLAVAGLLHPIAAVVIMTGSSALVIWNAFRVRNIPATAPGAPQSAPT